MIVNFLVVKSINNVLDFKINGYKKFNSSNLSRTHKHILHMYVYVLYERI